MNMKIKRIIAVCLLLTFAMPVLYAKSKNPIIRYFSRLLDETKAELAIGELITHEMLSEMTKNKPIIADEALSKRMQQLCENSSRPELQYHVYVVESESVDEIPFPGGYLILTSALMAKADTQAKTDFVLARNLALIMMRQPMKLIKKEDLYPPFLNYLKLPEAKREIQKLRLYIRDYLRSLPKMDHRRADIQGLLLTKSPEKTREAAIELLKEMSDKIWPVTVWDSGELDQRIKMLEQIKLPE